MASLQYHDALIRRRLPGRKAVISITCGGAIEAVGSALTPGLGQARQIGRPRWVPELKCGKRQVVLDEIDQVTVPQ